MYILIVSVAHICVLEPLIYRYKAHSLYMVNWWILTTQKECHRLMESSQQQYCWSFSIKWRRSFFVVAFWITYQWTIVENVLWKSNNGDVSYHVEKRISLNRIVAAFSSTNIYKIIENRYSSKKMLLWTIVQFEIFHS